MEDFWKNENFGQKNDRSLTEVLNKKNYEKVLSIVAYMDEHREIIPLKAEMIEIKVFDLKMLYMIL